MSKKWVFEHSSDGYIDLMKNQTTDMLEEYAKRLKNMVEDDDHHYEVVNKVGTKRANATVRTADEETYFKNANANYLGKALSKL